MKPKHIITLLFFLLSITAFTPAQMYDEQGNLTWEADLDIYGKVRTFAGRSLNECPFRWQGQYEDSETGLYYNRFRYYSPDEGIYISQDPIRLKSELLNLYTYVFDSNKIIDPFGLKEIARVDGVKIHAYPGLKVGGSEHAPLHVHVYDSDGNETRVLMEDWYDNGKLKGKKGDIYPEDPAMSKKMKKVWKKIDAEDLASRARNVFNGCG
jgi:RHS repeat-associated protein